MPWRAILSINPHARLEDHPKKSLKYEDFEFSPALLGTFLFTSVSSLPPIRGGAGYHEIATLKIEFSIIESTNLCSLHK